MKRILIIDDEATVRRVLRKSIEMLGDYETREADDGRRGIELCAEWRPDVILTDIFMPEQDGLETIRAFRKILPGTPVIAMSGGGNMGDLDVLRTARAMGAVTILAKPFDMSTLDDVLREMWSMTDSDKAGPAPGLQAIKE